VIPVLDEAGAIGPTIAALPRTMVDLVVVVDGGSADGTVAESPAAGAEVLIERRPRYGRASAAGADRAAALGAEIVLFLDGDGADPAEEAGRLIGPLIADEADFVLASRTRGGRVTGAMGLHQILAGRLIGWLVGVVSGVRYTDMSAFRAIGRSRLEALGMQEMTYGWNLEMQIRAAAAGLRIREVPLPYRRRLAGRSKVAGTLKASARILVTLLRTASALRRGARA
jgi:glycosyltransferase involved in cell wall biosynthesis